MFWASLAHPQEALHEHSFGGCSVLYIIIKSANMTLYIKYNLQEAERCRSTRKTYTPIKKSEKRKTKSAINPR
jgi:hypothetical protein